MPKENKRNGQAPEQPRSHWAAKTKHYSRYGQTPRQRVEPRKRDNLISDHKIDYKRVQALSTPAAGKGRSDFVFGGNPVPLHAGVPSLLKYTNFKTNWYT